MKTNIDKAIAERKRFYEQRRTEESIRGGASCGKNLYEAYDEETDQYIQLYVKNRYTVYAVSRSSEPIHDIFDFFPDFIELNTKKLHMIKDYHAVEEQDKMTREQQMKMQSIGVFMAGLSLTIMAELELLKYLDMRSRRILCGRPAGTYEVDMDEEG